MNKIVLENDTVIENNLDRAIELEVIEKNIFFTVNTLQITIHKTTSLEIDYHVLKRSKSNIKITVLPNVSFTLVERRKGRKLKVQYQLELQEKSEDTQIEIEEDNTVIKEKLNTNEEARAKAVAILECLKLKA